MHSKVSTNIFYQPPPFSIYYFIGWGKQFSNIIFYSISRCSGLPLVVTSIWVVSMEFTGEACWDDYSSNNSIYIIVVPILSILMVRHSFPQIFPELKINVKFKIVLQINLLLLISIMKVVVTSLRTRSSLTRQQLQVRAPSFIKSRNFLFPFNY